MIPPTSKETLDDPAKTLEWIKAQVSRLYSLSSTSPGRESVPLDRATYLHLYTAIHDYGVIAMHPGRPHIGDVHAGQALYDFLRRTIEGYCSFVAAMLSASERGKILEEYVEQWNSFEILSSQVANVFRTFDRHWVRREMDERRSVIERWKEGRREGRDGGVRPPVGVLWEVRELGWRVWRGVVLGVWEEGDGEGGGEEGWWGGREDWGAFEGDEGSANGEEGGRRWWDWEGRRREGFGRCAEVV
ncbi:unnamed protein product [Zymoseptoria tritici ST99CH_3D1]|nr:unnamed protein product [Zymoseptoria tritici ST99CH_3D1]